MEDPNDQMRSYIVIAESLRAEPVLVEETVEQAPPELPPNLVLVDLSDLAARLRGIMENSGGDYALGFEMAMQQAADMIETLIRRHTEGTQHLG